MSNILYRSIYFPIDPVGMEQFPENLKPSHVKGTHLVTIDHEGNQQFGNFQATVANGDRRRQIATGYVVLHSGVWVAVDRFFHLGSTVGTEATMRLLETKLLAFAEKQTEPIEFKFFDLDLMPDCTLSPEDRQVLQTHRDNQQRMLDWFVTIGFPHTVYN